MMKLVNMLDLGSSAARLVGSSPTTRTTTIGLAFYEKISPIVLFENYFQIQKSFTQKKSYAVPSYRVFQF